MPGKNVPARGGGEANAADMSGPLCWCSPAPSSLALVRASAARALSARVRRSFPLRRRCSAGAGAGLEELLAGGALDELVHVDGVEVVAELDGVAAVAALEDVRVALVPLRGQQLLLHMVFCVLCHCNTVMEGLCPKTLRGQQLLLPARAEVGPEP